MARHWEHWPRCAPERTAMILRRSGARGWARRELGEIARQIAAADWPAAVRDGRSGGSRGGGSAHI